MIKKIYNSKENPIYLFQAELSTEILNLCSSRNQKTIIIRHIFLYRLLYNFSNNSVQNFDMMEISQHHGSGGGHTPKANIVHTPKANILLFTFKVYVQSLFFYSLPKLQIFYSNMDYLQIFLREQEKWLKNKCKFWRDYYLSSSIKVLGKIM